MGKDSWQVWKAGASVSGSSSSLKHSERWGVNCTKEMQWATSLSQEGTGQVKVELFLQLVAQ